MPSLNLGLLALGLSVAGIGILGFSVFFNNRRSITNITFLLFSLITIVWGIANYLSYQAAVSSEAALWFLRFVIFFGVWHGLAFFQFSYVFPEEKINFPKWYRFALLPLAGLSSIINLTPLSFSRVVEYSPLGEVSVVQKGPGTLLFIGIVIFCILGGIILLIKKLRRARSLARTQLWFVFLGAVITISLIFVFNFFLPALFDWVTLIPLGALFILPFIAFTSYAIFKHHLLSIKVIATEIVAFLLAVATLFETILSQDFVSTLLRSGIFLLVLSFSVLLIQSVIREVKQREELQKLYEQLDEKNKKLDELSHFKSELLSLASHQIRSPLAAIKGFIQLIIAGSYGEVSDKIKETLGKVQRSADELIGLINTLLDVRKVEEGKMEYVFVRTDLNKLVTDVVDLLRPLAEAKKLEFAFASPGKEIPVNADAEKLKQVVQNLMDNAIKYTPSGFVKVELKEEGGAAVVSVSDSGLGISPTLIPYLFEEFVRDERVKKEIRGTGLGLYIARKIAEAHGGKMSAESPGEGKGSTFRFAVPEIK
jgi:signal transduction histidine kinase